MVLFMAVAGALAGTSPGEPEGYNGIPWGRDVGSLTGMEYVGPEKTAPDTLLYRRAGDDLSFGRARLKAIEYGFTANKFTVVILKVDSLLQYLLMKEEAFQRFGKGEELDPRAERFVWEGGATTIRLISAFDLS
jgi:hypothetical protein